LKYLKTDKSCVLNAGRESCNGHWLSEDTVISLYRNLLYVSDRASGAVPSSEGSVREGNHDPDNWSTAILFTTRTRDRLLPVRTKAVSEPNQDSAGIWM